MKKLIIILLFLLATFITVAFTHNPFIIYGGEKYYYCYSIRVDDTLVTPDGSLQIFHHKDEVYNHFGCDGIKPQKQNIGY